MAGFWYTGCNHLFHSRFHPCFEAVMKISHFFLKTLITGSGVLAVLVTVLLLRANENEKRQQALEAASGEVTPSEALVSAQTVLTNDRERVRQDAMDSSKVDEVSKTTTTKTTTPVVTSTSSSTSTTPKKSVKTTKTS